MTRKPVILTREQRIERDIPLYAAANRMSLEDARRDVEMEYRQTLSAVDAYYVAEEWSESDTCYVGDREDFCRGT